VGLGLFDLITNTQKLISMSLSQHNCGTRVNRGCGQKETEIGIKEFGLRYEVRAQLSCNA